MHCGHVDPTSDATYDLLVIGGGATGTGIALDAATRRLKVALVERDDFASGTSSKRAKLVHGGVRYLEKAVKELDYEQYKLVCAALRERRYFLDIAPHLSKAPYLWIGTKLYDLLAGAEGLKSSKAFPTLDASQIVGGLVYYDGQHNDARMNVTLAMTAAVYGAMVVNHVEVTRLEKDDDGKVCGVRVRDSLAGDDEEFIVRARGVINATGPFADTIHHLDEPSTRDIVMPSSGVHIVLPKWVGPADLGLIDPSSDGRVIFLLPWQDKIVAGTTDRACELDTTPIPEEQDVNWILNELKGLLAPELNLQRSDVLATWSGIRPLVRDPCAKNTEALTRSHLIAVSNSGLLTCVGGKWTTFREMAEDAVDTAISVILPNPPSPARRRGYTPTLTADLASRYVSDHLAHSYGDRAWEVASLSSPAHEPSLRIAGSAYPYLDGEVRYAVRSEYALTAADVLARRTRFPFLAVQTALAALPNIIAIMAEELNWDDRRNRAEFSDTVRFLRSMGLRDKLTDVLVS
ncbi:mitochondrial glycerol-3-phosphate dehydrogenase [Lipomyces orientalis]|uniref:Mitochondrial glycerol-3-phosphate dehydrogenase n=1 Tax=Lipomyces orientalis TaxID=1233043 RepID=A0ACC3TD78_9ASCO